MVDKGDLLLFFPDRLTPAAELYKDTVTSMHLSGLAILSGSLSLLALDSGTL